MSLGEWEGCDWEEIRGREGDPYRAWVRAPLDCPPPGAEPIPTVHLVCCASSIGSRPITLARTCWWWPTAA